MDRRVKFDFEIEFTNGGGLQGQGFRLDIDGDDISDAELAESIVKDMRLLMVDKVRILNKEIITETLDYGAGDSLFYSRNGQHHTLEWYGYHEEVGCWRRLYPGRSCRGRQRRRPSRRLQ